MKETKCNLINLQRFSDNDLPDKEMFLVKNHLEQCLNCRRRKAMFEKINLNLCNLPSAGVPADFTQKVMSRLPEIKKTNINWAWQLLLIFVLMAGVVFVCVNLNLQTDEHIAAFITLKIYITIKSVFVLLRHLFFSDAMFNLYKIIFKVGRELARSPYLVLAIRMIFYEMAMFAAVFMIWNLSRGGNQRIKTHGGHI